MSDKPLILHVVESLGGGVETAIDSYINTATGFDHVVLGRRRDGYEIGSTQNKSEVAMVDGHYNRIRQVRKTVIDLKPDIVHAHSSFGGAYARLARLSKSIRVVYTPHCFAFERRDINPLARAMYWSLESAFKARTDHYLAVSERERQLANRLIGRDVPHSVVHQASDRPFAPLSLPRDPRSTLKVVAVGRAQAQKGAKFFARAAQISRETNANVEWQWVGGGEDSDVHLLQSAGVDITGWLPRDQAMQHLANADIYIHSAEWEGFPLTIVEATALGLPVIARRIPSIIDLVHSVVDTPEEMVSEIRQIADGHSATVRSVEKTWRTVSSTCTQAQQQKALEGCYRTLLGLNAKTSAGR